MGWEMDAYPPPLPVDPLPRPPVHPARGWFLIVIGTGLSVGIAWIANFIHQAIVRDRTPGASSHWNGSPEFTRTVFELFGTVFVFGLVAVAAGIYILRIRRISRVLGAVMVLLALGMGFFGYLITTTAHAPR